MRTIKFLLQKEFLQIFRNKGMLPIIFLMPVIQLVVLSFAATYELREVHFHLVDYDQSVASQRLVDKFPLGAFADQSANLSGHHSPGTLTFWHVNLGANRFQNEVQSQSLDIKAENVAVVQVIRLPIVPGLPRIHRDNV